MTRLSLNITAISLLWFILVSGNVTAIVNRITDLNIHSAMYLNWNFERFGKILFIMIRLHCFHCFTHVEVLRTFSEMIFYHFKRHIVFHCIDSCHLLLGIKRQSFLRNLSGWILQICTNDEALQTPNLKEN